MDEATDRIELHRDAKGWHATFSGSHAAAVIQACHTVTLPTAFTARAPAEAVVREIQRRNPGAVVVVR